MASRPSDMWLSSSSFVAAAEHLDISAPTVSKYLTYVEKRLGVRLLNRNSRTLSLPEAGRVYFPVRASFGSHSTYSPRGGSNLSNRRRDSCLAHDSHRRKNLRRSNQRHLQLDRGGVMHTRLRRQPWHRYTGSPSDSSAIPYGDCHE